MGLLYLAGSHGFPRDNAAALRWLTRVARQGQVAAAYEVGAYYTLAGPHQDYARAARWLTRAARRGNANARYSLAILYATGHGVPQDLATAYAWARLAEDSGLTEARPVERWAVQGLTIDGFARAMRAYRRLQPSLSGASDRRAGQGD